jgi:Ribbon-helix-helix domain
MLKGTNGIDGSVPLNVSILHETKEELVALAEATGVKVSEIVREILEDYTTTGQFNEIKREAANA